MSVTAGTRIPRDKIATTLYRPEGAVMTSGQTCSAGWILARAAAGTLQVATEVAGLLPGGFATKDLVTADSNGNDYVNADTGIYSIQMSTLAGDAFTATSAPGPAYFVDNQYVGALPINPSTGAVRSIAALFLRLDANDPNDATGRGIFWIGPEGVAIAQGIASATGSTSAPPCRAVITSIAAYVGTLTGTLTASATGLIGAQDGITLAAGDRVFLPLVTGGAGGATVAADTGEYIVVTPGATSPATKFVLTRPPEYLHGAKIPEAFTVKIGSEGTAWAGIDWRAFPATASKLIGTDDPHFWPRVQGYAYTIGTGFVADGGLGNAVFYLKNAHGFTSSNQTSAHANWASTITTGAGTGALVFTGTASDVMVGQAINF